MTAAASLCQACFGSTAAGTTGRKRSVLLLAVAIALALWMQYSFAPSIVTQSGWAWKSYRYLPGLGNVVYQAWHGPCEQYDPNLHPNTEQASLALLNQCAGNAGVYRPTAVAFLFFLITAAATKMQPQLNKEAWPAKYCLYLFSVAVTIFLNSSPFFTGIFLWTARLGATLFLVLQQVILIDIAYDWNEDWVERADQQDRLSYGTGATWFRAIVATCAGFYIAALTGIGLLYHYFCDCPENTWIVTLTLLGMIALTVIQLSGTEGSLLTSSIISVYAVYLAYSMVSKNPNGECNPQLGGSDAWGIAIGLTLTAVSLAWTAFSWTAEERLTMDSVQSARSVTGLNPMSMDNGRNLDVPFLDPNDSPTAGLVLESSDMISSGAGGTGAGSNVWKLNVVMALICCFVAMTLTGWGGIVILEQQESEQRAANPTVGRMNMAMIGISQWIAILLYIWTLAAPRLFPDREFS
jgi:serine incorporator 1/3